MPIYSKAREKRSLGVIGHKNWSREICSIDLHRAFQQYDSLILRRESIGATQHQCTRSNMLTMVRSGKKIGN